MDHQYYFSKLDYDNVIKENARAVKVYGEFTDCGWILDSLSRCYETLALAYAYKNEYDRCLDHLEKACECALKYDGLDYDLTYKIYDVPDEIGMEEEKLQASRSLLGALSSPEREIYAPIRETKRFKAIVVKLEEGN